MYSTISRLIYVHEFLIQVLFAGAGRMFLWRVVAPTTLDVIASPQPFLFPGLAQPQASKNSGSGVGKSTLTRANSD